MNKNDIWKKYEKNKVIKSNIYLRIYDSINKSNRENVIIKEYNKCYIDTINLKSIEKFYKLINSITLLEIIEEKVYIYIIVEKGVFDLENYLNQRNQGFSPYNIKKILTQLNNYFKILQKEKVISIHLEPSDIIIFINDMDLTFKLSINNFKDKYHFDIDASYPVFNPKVLSPELLRGDHLTNKTDIWSLGIIIYYMYFKEYPFNGRSEVQIYQMIESNPILKKTNDDDLNDLISKMLKKDFNERISWDDYFNHSFFKKQFPEEIKIQGNDILLTIKEQVNDIHKNNIDINILKLGYETQIEKLNSEIKKLKENNNQIKEKDEIIKKMKKDLDDKIKENNNINRQLINVTESYQQLKRKYEKK